jgi:hypothetical protein
VNDQRSATLSDKPKAGKEKVVSTRICGETTPNSDVIYALGFVDLKEDGPIVIEVPPGLQGTIDDFWQRPIPSVGEIEGRPQYLRKSDRR